MQLEIEENALVDTEADEILADVEEGSFVFDKDEAAPDDLLKATLGETFPDYGIRHGDTVIKKSKVEPIHKETPKKKKTAHSKPRITDIKDPGVVRYLHDHDFKTFQAVYGVRVKKVDFELAREEKYPGERTTAVTKQVRLISNETKEATEKLLADNS